MVNYANYVIFSSTILGLFYQDSEKENHFCAALTTIFSFRNKKRAIIIIIMSELG